MLRKLVFLALTLVGFFLCSPRAIHASGGDPNSALSPDGVLRTLDPNRESWFRFNYRGDGSPIQIELTDSGNSDIGFAVYTSVQIEEWNAGKKPKAVGQITRAGGVPNHNLVWVGKFRSGGTYYVAVRNLMSVVTSYRLFATGPSVSLPQISTVPESNPQSENQKPATVPELTSQSENQKPATAPDSNSQAENQKPAADPVPPPVPTTTAAVEDRALGSLSTLSPELARTVAARNGGRVVLTHSVRLISGAVYPNTSIHIAAPRVQIIGDPNHPPLIIPPAGAYGIVAKDVDAPVVSSLNIATTTQPQDQWTWYAAITSGIVNEPKYGGVLFVNTRQGVIKNITIVAADGTTDGASHSAGVTGITLINSVGTLVANNRLNGNIFGLIIVGGSGNVLLDNTIANNIRQGLVPGTGDLCNGCDSAGVAITYGPDGLSSNNNMIGLPGHGNTISGGNGVFVICHQKHLGGGGGNHNFFIENNLSAEWNAFEAVATDGNIFVRNVINFSKDTVGYWLTGSNFTVDSHYADGFLEEDGKVQVQVTDNRFGNSLSGAMRVVENPRLPDIAALSPAVREYLQQVPPHSPYEARP